jgi:3-hydroxybutyryl-CoA dehydrogenase
VVAVKRVGVIGSGIMGSGIAEVVSRSGFEVLVCSRSQDRADACLGRLAKSFARQVDKGALPADESEAALARVRPVSDLRELELCDLVVESVVEDRAVKSDLLAELNRVCPEETVLATNTSTLPVVDLAVASGRPDRVCGMHFFNPAPVMSLVEVVPALTTSEATVETVRQVAEECGKTPVKVADRSGFVVNALLFPYLNGAVDMLERGVATQSDIDTAMKGGCGFPMGPFELLDLIGLDTSVSILNVLHAENGDESCRPVPLLRHMVAAERLGRKSGQGFYDYSSPKGGGGSKNGSNNISKNGAKNGPKAATATKAQVAGR